MVSGRAVGALHTQKPKLREVELDFEKTNGPYGQRSEKLLELKVEEKN
jgi:hypothetical protein